MIVFHSPVSTVLVSTYSFNLSAIAQVLAGLYGIHLPVEVQMLLNCRKAANKLLYMTLSYYFIATGLNLTKSMKLYLQTQLTFWEKKNKKNTYTCTQQEIMAIWTKSSLTMGGRSVTGALKLLALTKLTSVFGNAKILLRNSLHNNHHLRLVLFTNAIQGRQFIYIFQC